MNLKTFKHGIHPLYCKELTARKEIERAPIPKTVTVPLQQHLGTPCQPLVKKGDVVEEGQKIGDVVTFVTAPVHSPISGKVKDIERYPYPVGGKVLSVVIESNEEVKEWPENNTGLDMDLITPQSIRDAVREAGIVGMGGAAFPTHVKLSPPKDKKIDTVIMNGCECEPFLTSDHSLMLEFPEKVLWGMKVIMKAVNAQKGYIGIEENKLDAINIIQEVVRDISPEIEVVPLETKYPQGAEKMLIKATLNRDVPMGKLPLDVGVVVNNVGTAAAIYDALKFKKPLIERIVTVSGNGLTEPKNLILRIGTSFKEAIENCGGMIEGGERVVINGGPMMGVAQTDLDVPVIKATSGITVLTGDEIKPKIYHPCIKCAGCVEACPVNLMPYRLGDLARLSRVDEFKRWGGLSCVECGCCSFVCPARRPLVQWIRVGKVKLREEDKPGSA
ncbi:MAG: electron transport complex subunit RsxC [Thermodesulfobacteriota bacterium]